MLENEFKELESKMNDEDGRNGYAFSFANVKEFIDCFNKNQEELPLNINITIDDENKTILQFKFILLNYTKTIQLFNEAREKVLKLLEREQTDELLEKGEKATNLLGSKLPLIKGYFVSNDKLIPATNKIISNEATTIDYILSANLKNLWNLAIAVDILLSSWVIKKKIKS